MSKMKSTQFLTAFLVMIASIGVVSPAMASTIDDDAAQPPTAAVLKTMTFEQAFGSGVTDAQAAEIAPSDVFSAEVIARVPAGSTYSDIASGYPLSALYSDAELTATAKAMKGGQMATTGPKGTVHTNATFACSPVCGVKFTYLETRLVLAAVLAGNGSAAQVACGFVPLFPLQAGCKVAFAVYYGTVAALLAVTLAQNPSLCLLWAPYVPGTPFFPTKC